MDNEEFLNKIKQLEDELLKTKEQLSKYTMKNKNYYEKTKTSSNSVLKNINKKQITRQIYHRKRKKHIIEPLI